MSRASKGTALVIGASSGSGAIYADRLAARGYDLILVRGDSQPAGGERQRHGPAKPSATLWGAAAGRGLSLD